MTNPARQLDAMLDAYLDGALSDSERRLFERAMESDSALREAVESQKRIDDSLARLFTPGKVAAPPLPPGRGALPSRLWAAAAAVLLLLTAGVVWSLLPPAAPPDPLTGLYMAQVRSGFEPQVVCNTDEEFIVWTRKRYGQPLLVRDDQPAGVDVVGWVYNTVMSNDSALMLGRSHGEEVIVIIDKAANDTGLALSPESRLRLHRRVVDDLVLYELTPEPQPAFLPRFFNPEPGARSPAAEPEAAPPGDA